LEQTTVLGNKRSGEDVRSAIDLFRKENILFAVKNAEKKVLGELLEKAIERDIIESSNRQNKIHLLRYKLMIEPHKWYTISELLKIGAERYFPIKTRLSILRLIRNGRLPVLNAGTKEKPVYYFKGEWLLAFLSNYGQLKIHQRELKQSLPMVRKARTDRRTSPSKKKHTPGIKKSKKQ